MNGRKPPLWTVTALALVVSLIAPWTVFAAVWTDKPDYAPGETVTIFGDNSDGAGYLPGETVRVEVSGPNGYSAACEAVVDESGAWSCQVTLWDSELAFGEYTYTATGLTSGVQQQGMFTDGNAEISGYVRDTNNKPISDATVECTGGCDKTASTTTDANGKYPPSGKFKPSFSGSGCTTIYLTASKSGYDSQTKDIYVCNNNSYNLDFSLEPKPSDTTPPVISYSISGTKGNGDWYVSDVFVDWTVTDPESAVTILEGCVDTTINYDTSGVTLTCRARSAGGTSQASVTIQRDATPPSVSVTPDRDPDHDGWYNAPVAFTVSGTDATSGLAGCAPGGTYSGPDGASVSFQASCEDYAGNIGYGSYGFKYDATAPTISGSASPAANEYGWNNTDVAVTFTCNDETSGIASCGPGATLTDEGAEQYVTGSAVDNAGNSASATVGPINIDKTPPTVTASASPEPNANGWNNTNVTVSFSGDDALSGIAACDPAVVLSSEGAGQSATGSCTDKAGNIASATASGINIDKTPPTISTALDKSPASTGWFNGSTGAPTVSFTCSDNLSGLAGDCPDDYTFGEGENQSYFRTISDKAGNSASAGVSNIDVDLTAPEISGSADPEANAYGWNNTNVAVTFTCSDGTSGIASCGPNATLTAEGAGQYVTGSAVDNAGNSASATVGPINIDKTPPTVTASASPAPNAYGWNNTDVTVSFSGADALSGIAACDPAVVLSDEGAGQSATGSCTDKAGNSASATASGINIDKTAPSITWSNGPQDGASYYYGFVPAAPTCTAEDALSGLAGDCTISGYGTTVGSHTLTAAASDKAGNVKTETRRYTVRSWTLFGFYQPVDMGGVWNVVKGGSTVPLKFEIFAGSTELTDTAYVKGFTAVQVACTSGLGEDEVEFTTTGGTSLRYDPVAGQFIQNWQTPKKPGFCYRVAMTAQDGSSLVAFFKLK